MSSVELSVVIPTYGRHEVVQRAVNSALGQDPELEVIVVDDGSPEPITLAADARVRLLRLETNSGAAGARNAGVEEARADWIAFLDSDDAWTPGSLLPRLTAAQATNAFETVIWTCGFRDLWPDGRRRERMPVSAATPSIFASGCWSCPGSTALFSRAAWRRSGAQDTSLRRLEDYDWLLRWSLGGGRLAVHPIIGAEITRGGRAEPEVIAAATASLLEKHAAIDRDLHQRMRSYSELERATAYLGHGRPIEGAGALARSWLLRPRFHVALERFWTSPQAR